jgi:hypothetical protein
MGRLAAPVLSSLLAQRGSVFVRAWYQPTKPAVAELFKALAQASIGVSKMRQTVHYLTDRFEADQHPQFEVRETAETVAADVSEFLSRKLPTCDLEADSLNGERTALTEVDNAYRAIGLSRQRTIWAVRSAGGNCLLAAVSYSGPRGLNFSFLENRTELVIGGLDGQQEPGALRALLSALSARRPQDLGCLPILVAPEYAYMLAREGIGPARTYERATLCLDSLDRALSAVSAVIGNRVQRRVALLQDGTINNATVGDER